MKDGARVQEWNDKGKLDFGLVVKLNCGCRTNANIAVTGCYTFKAQKPKQLTKVIHKMMNRSAGRDCTGE